MTLKNIGSGFFVSLLCVVGACGAQNEQSNSSVQSVRGAQSASADVQLCFDKANTTAEMLKCATLDYEKADKELNKAWPSVKAFYKQVDANIASLPSQVSRPAVPASKLIVQAQQKWIVIRDNDCLVQASSFGNGSFYPVSLTLCKAEKTKDRTKEFKRLVNETDVESAVEQEILEIQALYPDSCSDSSTVGQKLCLSVIADEADRRLNTTYNVLKASIKDNLGAQGSKPIIDTLVKSELAWINLRDASVEAQAQTFWSGTGYGAIYLDELVIHTLRRKNELIALFPANE